MSEGSNRRIIREGMAMENIEQIMILGNKTAKETDELIIAKRKKLKNIINYYAATDFVLKDIRRELQQKAGRKMQSIDTASLACYEEKIEKLQERIIELELIIHEIKVLIMPE